MAFELDPARSRDGQKFRFAGSSLPDRHRSGTEVVSVSRRSGS